MAACHDGTAQNIEEYGIQGSIFLFTDPPIMVLLMALAFSDSLLISPVMLIELS